MTVIRILVGLIGAILRVFAQVLTSGIGLLVSGITLVLIVLAFAFSGVTSLETLRAWRKRKG